ncbi:hypothetical protein [Dictyobacter aurantiacus]|uniref:Uncharacterized protein n=1 Tax=Dictyobacter aurantiacus TaxID=1936993 RepID=A0A401ZH53_9CHLR|nr:hypothetical protein [Dictyobacter aurantiacus]GCE06123.1 hypothetical protein KDAU_34520 [Dictyobacter aurantiacus]
MTTTMFPWILIALLSGMLIGLVIGVYLASSLVRGHFSHFLTHGSQRQAPPSPHPKASGPFYEDELYTRRPTRY